MVFLWWRGGVFVVFAAVFLNFCWSGVNFCRITEKVCKEC